MSRGLTHSTPLELATDWLNGSEPLRGEALAWTRIGPPSPRQALEAVVRRALERPPCVVDFSGGRDSSLVLAIATHVARREGLALPVPRTNRFPLDAPSHEDEWQELVVRHLGLRDWEIASVTTELDVVGERAQRFLTRYGRAFPARLYVLTASLELARGGARLSGEGGDEILGPWRATYARLALESPRKLARARARRVVARRVAPGTVRRVLLSREYAHGMPSASWLRPDAAREFARECAHSDAEEPLAWHRALRWHLGRRVVAVHVRNVEAVAADYDVLTVNPLLEPEVVAALARCGGRFGFANRTQAMRFLAPDLLPDALLARETKTAYNTAYFTEAARSFAESWDGSGVDGTLVDPEVLAKAWLSDTPPSGSFGLLQSAWLASQPPPPGSDAPGSDGSP